MMLANRQQKTFSKEIIFPAIEDAFKKLHPYEQAQNLVMFVVYLGAIITTIIIFGENFDSLLNIQICLWLWFTVLFANFAEALAESRGKAQASSLRRTRSSILARKLMNGKEVRAESAILQVGDLVVCEAQDIIPSDGEVVEGVATIDESAITGESAPVIRESGGDRSAVTGGTRVLSDRIIVRITSKAGETFLDRMIHLIESAKRQKTPNEIALTILLVALTLIFLVAVISLKPFIIFSERASGLSETLVTVPVLVGLLVCLIPTTIGALLSAVGISGMDQLLRLNILAMSGRAVEAAGDVDVLLLDKTGTITLGNRQAIDFIPAPAISRERLAEAAQLASLADETPEGRSIVIFAKDKFKIRPRNIQEMKAKFIPFSASTRMSGVQLVDKKIIKGAADAVEKFIKESGGQFPNELKSEVNRIARLGGTPLVVAEDNDVMGCIHLKDVIKGGIKERFSHLRNMGITTVMITGDNPLTASAIAAEAGVDDFIAEARPEAKLARIRAEQDNGHLVAMIGDGTNDAPALAQADVGIAMNTGTQAAREAGNMIDLDSNPTKLIEVVEIGKKILMTRGALTTFSIANDVAKYFAILPALFGGLYAGQNSVGPLAQFNLMGLASPQSAILSAVIFNALIIILLIPLALKGVKYQPLGASVILRKNILVYGIGGIIAPFFGIKLIDMILVWIHLA